MAKAKKVVEEIKTEVPETITPIVEETLPVVEEPVFEVKESTITKEDINEMTEQIKEARKQTNEEIQEELSMDQKIVQFVDSMDSDVKLNDFLKSLFPIKSNEPPRWQLQGNSRKLRGLLEDMVNKGQIVILNNTHRRLGDCYYPDNTTGKAEHYNLNTMPIVAKK